MIVACVAQLCAFDLQLRSRPLPRRSRRSRGSTRGQPRSFTVGRRWSVGRRRSVGRRQSVGRPRGPMRITSRLHSHSLWTHIVQGCRRWRAQQSKSFPTSTCTFVRAPGYAGRIVASAVLVVAEGVLWRPVRRLSAVFQLGQRNTCSTGIGSISCLQRNSTSEACRCQMCVAFECGCPSRTPPS